MSREQWRRISRELASAEAKEEKMTAEQLVDRAFRGWITEAVINPSKMADQAQLRRFMIDAVNEAVAAERAKLKTDVLELLKDLLSGSMGIRVGGTENGSWSEYAVDQEQLLNAIDKKLQELT